VPTRFAASGAASVALTIQPGSAEPAAHTFAWIVSLPAPTLTSNRIQYWVFALAVNGTVARTPVLPPLRRAISSLFAEVCRRAP
jgi:hypothetical protein